MAELCLRAKQNHLCLQQIIMRKSQDPRSPAITSQREKQKHKAKKEKALHTDLVFQNYFK